MHRISYDLKKNTLSCNFFYVIYLLILIFFNLFCYFVFTIDILTLVKFFISQILIIIPGVSVLLFFNFNIPLISFLLTSYLIGYGISILEYFIGYITNDRLCLIILFLAVLLFSLYIIIKNRKKLLLYISQYVLNTDNETTLIFFVLLFLVNLFIYAGSYTDKLNIEHDLAYWINNSVSLKLGFPPENLFMAGTKLQYHYFSSVQIAFTSLIYDIDVYTLSVPFYVITKTVIMIGAVDFFLEIFKVDVKGKILGFIIILFTTGFENFSIVTYFSHILLLPFGFDIGFAYGILFLTLLYYQWLHEFNFKIFLLASLFWFVCIGAKAPVASILLLTTAFLCLNKLFEKKVVLPLVYGFSMLGIFIFISIYFVGLLSVAEATNGAYYIKFHTLSEMAITVKGIKIPLFLSIFLKLLSLNFFYFVMLGISFSLLVLFVRKKNISKNELYFILSMFYSHILGILLWIIIKADGKSEMYYAMGSFIPLYFIFVIIYNKGRLYISNNGKIILKKEYIYAIFSILVFFGVECFLFFPYGTNIFYITGRNIINFVQNNNSCNTIAFEWIRKNSKKTAIVVSDAVFVNNYSYVCGILTERQQYLESYHMLRFAGIDIQNEIKRRKRLIQNIFNNDVRALIELRSEIGAGNYIVQNVTVTPDFIYNEELLLPVFESDKFRVFKIK